MESDNTTLFTQRKGTVKSFALCQLLCAAVGFSLARTSLFTDMPVFAAAFAAALPGQYTLTAVFGSALSVLTESGNSFFGWGIAAVSAAAVLNCAVSYFISVREKPPISAADAFLCCILASVFSCISIGFSVTDFGLSVLDGAISGIAAYFFARTVGFSDALKNNAGLNTREIVCICISLCALLMSLCTFSIYTFVPARIFAVLLILLSAYFGHETGGSVAGICFGLAASISGAGINAMPGFAIGGLVAGTVSGYGQLAAALVFFAVNGFACAVSDEAVAAMLLESFIACIIFLLIPRARLEKMRRAIISNVLPDASDSARNSVVLQLTAASNSIAQVSRCMERVTGILGRHMPGVQKVGKLVYSNVCSVCGMKSYCWETNKEESIKAFENIIQSLRENEYLSLENSDEPLLHDCVRAKELVASFNQCYLSYIAAANSNERIGQIREIVTEQFGTVSDMLGDMAEEIKESGAFFPQLAAKSADVFRSHGIPVKRISCREDKLGRIEITLLTQRIQSRADMNAISMGLSKVCRREMALPGVSDSPDGSLITVSQKEVFAVKTGAVQIPQDKNGFCGDYFDCFNDGRGRENVILSDGMGTGGRAAVDAAISTELFSDLIRAGLSFDCALRVVNSALLVKSTEEALSTLDVVCVDLFSGTAEFMKAGAAASFVRRGGEAFSLEISALPVGILREVGFGRRSLELESGDIIIVASDGITGADDGWIEQELLKWGDESAQMLAEHLAAESVRRRGKGRADDLTVIAVCIS